MRDLALKQTVITGSPAVALSGENQPLDRAERRKSKRFAVSASAEILELSTSTRLNGRVSDLGMGGCYIDTVSPFSVGTSLLVNLTSERHNVHARANVVYAHRRMGMGLAFTEMTANQKANLSAWLGELSGETAKTTSTFSAITSNGQERVVAKAGGGSESAGLRGAVYELVSLLEKKRVLSEEEVESLRERLSS
jgi:PilZ domain-containing protein